MVTPAGLGEMRCASLIVDKSGSNDYEMYSSTEVNPGHSGCDTDRSVNCPDLRKDLLERVNGSHSPAGVSHFQ